MDEQKTEQQNNTNTERIDKLLIAILNNISTAKSILGNSEVSKLLADAEIACIEAKELNSSIIRKLSANKNLSNTFEIENEKMKEMLGVIKNKKILILEDEKPVAELIKALLRKAGCLVVVFSDAKSIIEEYKKNLNANAKYDAVIIDLIVGGELSGVECFNALLEIDPNVNAILSSGYCDAVDNDIKSKFKAILPKPFTYGELVAALARTIR